jgi:uncharacterized protein
VLDWLQARGWTDGIAAPLAQSVGAADPQIVLTAPLAAAPGPVFIDQETLIVEAVDQTGTILSVDRGARGTTAAAHTAGASVQAVLSPYSRPIGPPFTDIPLPIENYAAFQMLFDTGGSAASYGTDYLAAAVRSFFAQGGRRCYVVCMDNPVDGNDTPAGKLRKLAKLLPDDLFSLSDRRTWHGIGHLAGLPDVSIVALPDLPVLTASTPVTASGAQPVKPTGPIQFVECAQTTLAAAIPPAPPPPMPPAPRLTPTDYGVWAQNLGALLSIIQNSFREVQLVAAFPLPQDLDAAAASENLLSDTLAQDIHDVIASQMPESPGAGLSTTFLQLGYPWLKTSGSGVLSESLEPPDGVLAGIVARNALTRGAFRNATKVVPSEVTDVYPMLPAVETEVPSMPLVWNGITTKPLITRLSLFGFTPAGLRLLSDVTAYPGESYRPACVHRLVAVISRAARRFGEQVVFAQNGPLLWARVQQAMQNLMMRLWRLNALDGATLQDAFSVRCDSSTMTQNDLDSGRLVAVTTFQTAASVELIRVTLAMETSGATSQSIALLAEAS